MKAGGLGCVPRSKQLPPFAHIEHNKNAHGNRGEGGTLSSFALFQGWYMGYFILTHAVIFHVYFIDTGT